MDQWKKNSNRIYIVITVIAILLAGFLCLDYGIRKKAEQSQVRETVTTKTEKAKKDKVRILVNTETIRDGLANMGVLITQEYYLHR